MGDLFGALVDEKHDEVHVGVVIGDRAADLLEQNRLAGFGSGYDESTLASPDRSNEVDDAKRERFLTSAGQPEGFTRMLTDQLRVGRTLR
jgi:hypothetical protein